MVIVNVIFAVAVSYRLFLAFQQSGYKTLKLLQYNNKTLKFGFISLLIAFLGFILDINYPNKNFYYIVGAIILIFELFHIVIIYKTIYIKPLAYTKRLTRLLIVYIIIIISFNMLYFSRVRMLIFGVYILLPIFVKLSYFICYPLDYAINHKHILRAKTILDRDNLLKIGITGSYGKTTIKNILEQILSYDYNVVATPHSYNTPLGIAKSTDKVDIDTQIFIAEMGARHRGDIKELCDIVQPEIAIITGINSQHQETFKSIENTCNTKYELIENLRGRKLAIFNGDNEYTSQMASNTKGIKSIVVGSDEVDGIVKNIKTSTTGTQFELLYNNTSIRLSTRLLGRHNSLNIAICGVIALELDMDIIDIVKAVANLKPIEHRLQLINGARGITIIDDSYNCNPDGAIAALEVLQDFNSRKIIITPGMVELGEMSCQENKKLGERIAKVCDVVILIRCEMTKYIIEGLGKVNMNNVHQFNSLREATTNFSKLLKSGDTLLILNDLPDSIGGLL